MTADAHRPPPSRSRTPRVSAPSSPAAAPPRRDAPTPPPCAPSRPGAGCAGYPSIPTGPEVVASYIAHRAELVAHSTISRDVAAISAAHLDKGLGDPTARHGVRQALRSAGRTLGTAPSRRATPLTTVLMRQVIGAMDDLETATGKRDRAILLLGLPPHCVAASSLPSPRTTSPATTTACYCGSVARRPTRPGEATSSASHLGAHPETCPVLALEASARNQRQEAGGGEPQSSPASKPLPYRRHRTVGPLDLTHHPGPRRSRQHQREGQRPHRRSRPDLGLGTLTARRTRDIRRGTGRRPDDDLPHHEAPPIGFLGSVRAARQRSRRLYGRQDRSVVVLRPGTVLGVPGRAGEHHATNYGPSAELMKLLTSAKLTEHVEVSAGTLAAWRSAGT